MKRVGRKKTSKWPPVGKVGAGRDVATGAATRSPEQLKRYPALYAYFDSLRPGEASSALGAMVFVLEYFAKRGIVIGDGGRPLGACHGDPTELLEQHRQLAMLMLMLGEELGLSSLVPGTDDAAVNGPLDG